MNYNHPKLIDVFNQARYRIPAIVVTEKGEPNWLIMPYAPDGSKWLQGGRSRHNHKYIRDGIPPHWAVPKTWLNELIPSAVDRFGSCYLIQPYRELEKCAPACWNANGFKCTCSCPGNHHGLGDPDGRWYIINDACAISWGELRLSCKLITPNNVNSPKRKPSKRIKTECENCGMLDVPLGVDNCCKGCICENCGRSAFQAGGSMNDMNWCDACEDVLREQIAANR